MDEEKKRILTWIGALIVGIQGTERIVDLVMTYVFQGKQKVTVQILERLEAQRQSRTLGRLVKVMQDRVGIHPAFDKLLENFVEHRNQLMHRLDDIPGWDLDTEDGRKIAWNFLHQLYKETHAVMQIFISFLIAWEKQHKLGIVKDLTPEMVEALPQITEFTAIVDDLVFAKEDIIGD
jgi:hypothetical protein